MQDKTVVFTRANHESTTSYLYYWVAGVVALARTKFASVIDIEGAKVTRKEVSGRLKKMKPDFVHFNGHGGAEELYGHDFEVIIDKSNCSNLKGSIVYALSCESAQTLGPLTTSKGARAYIGYRQPFAFAQENSKYAHATEDKAAELFLEPALKVSESILKGKSVDEAVSIGKNAFTDSIYKAANSEVQSGHSAYIPYLLWDREHLTYSGDGRAGLS